LARKIFFWPISEEVQLGDSVTLFHEVDSRRDFQKERFNQAEEITSCNMGAREQYLLIYFHGRLMEGILQIYITNVCDFYTVCCWWHAKLVEYTTYYFSPQSLNTLNFLKNFYDVRISVA